MSMCERFHKLPSEIYDEPMHELLMMTQIAAIHNPAPSEEMA